MNRRATESITENCKIECTMAHKRTLGVLNRTLQDLCNNQKLLVGMILLAGDFRQTPRVIPRSATADEINVCLKSHRICGDM